VQSPEQGSNGCGIRPSPLEIQQQGFCLIQRTVAFFRVQLPDFVKFI
jgi:hypothetical protein